MEQGLSPHGTTMIKDALKSQYKASLSTLINAIGICDDDLWTSQDYPNRTWQMVYHCLFFTNLYLYQRLEDRENWSLHRRDHQTLGDSDGKQPYTRAELVQCTQELLGKIDGLVDALDLNAMQSGFHWYRVNKLEHQLVNIRHLQHHVAQLQDRIRNKQHVGVGWIRDGLEN